MPETRSRPAVPSDPVVRHLPCAVALLTAAGELRQASGAWFTVLAPFLACQQCAARAAACGPVTDRGVTTSLRPQIRGSCLDCLLGLVEAGQQQAMEERLQRFLRNGGESFTMPLSMGRDAPAELQLRRLSLPDTRILLAVLSGAACNAVLYERAERLQVLIDAMPDFLCFKDGQGRWLEANVAGLRLFALDGVDYRGRTDAELAEQSPLLRDALLACQESDERAWAAGKAVRVEEVLSLPDGGQRVFDVYKLPLFEPDGRRKGLMVLGREITSLRQAEERLRRSEANLAKAQRIARLGYWEWHPGADRFYGSEELFRILGISPQPTLSLRRLRAFVHPADRRRRFAAFRDAVRSRAPYAVTYRLLRASGEVRIVHEEGEVAEGEDGRISRLFGTLQDVTELKRSAFQLELAARIFNAAVEGITVTDAAGRILMVNPAFTRITGYSADEAIGKRPNILKSDRHDRQFYKAMWDQLLAEGVWQGEIWNRRKDGEVYPEWLSITAIKDDTGRTTHYVGVFHDMSQLRSYEEKLRFHENHDPLTGLPNRFLFLDRLEMAVGHAAGRGHGLAVLLVDLDNFKHVNDSLGHTAGDLLLQKAAERIAAQAGSGRTVARLSSDDFAILLDQVADGRQAGQVAERIIGAMAEPFDLRACEVSVTVSVGIALYPEDGRKPEALLKNAELAMYEAKAKGKNTFRLFTREMDAQVTQRLFIEHSLRRAVERDALLVHYQPKVSLEDGRICGAEALVRWQRADGSFVPPAEFIPIAEETGLVVRLGEQVLRRACGQAREWLDAGHRDFVVSVNVSFRQFQQPDLAERVAAVLADTGLPAANLELEITESAVMANEAETLALLDRLKALGVRLALDDFGTGYSSLSYLRRLPIHTLKIDRSFVRDIPEDTSCLAVAASILELAHRLGLEVVVEGVENEEQLAFFWRRGAAELQGFLFSPPVEGSVLERMLAEDRRLALPEEERHVPDALPARRV